MKDGHRRTKVGILGPFSFGNLGNAALQESVVRQVHRYFPGAEIYGCYFDAESTFPDPVVKPFPLNRMVSEPGLRAGPALAPEQVDSSSPWKEWVKRIPLARQCVHGTRGLFRRAGTVRDEILFLLKAYKFACDCRLLVVGMGGVIDDVWNGAWGDPYSLFKWAMLARLAKTPFIFLSVGAERVESRLGRLFLRNALRLASYRSYRDVESKEKAEKMGVHGPNFVFPDLAFGLPLGDTSRAPLTCGTRRLAAISPMAYCDPRVWPTKDHVKYKRYLSLLAELAEWFLSQGYCIVLFATQIRMDQAPLAELRELLLKRVPAGSAADVEQANLHDVHDLVSLARRVDLVVSSRLHGVIIPCLAGTPVLALSHSSKINRLMEDIGLEAYCTDIDTADMRRIQQQVLAIEAHQDEMRQHIRRKVSTYQTAVEEQFKSVLGSLGS